MGDSDVIKSILYVWISRMAINRKWCYDACPKCKKMAEKYNKCQNCGFVIEDTNLNFIMGVEMADSYGSLWITAYDDLGKKIFHDLGASAARHLQTLSKDELA